MHLCTLCDYLLRIIHRMIRNIAMMTTKMIEPRIKVAPILLKISEDPYRSVPIFSSGLLRSLSSSSDYMPITETNSWLSFRSSKNSPQVIRLSSLRVIRTLSGYYIYHIPRKTMNWTALTKIQSELSAFCKTKHIMISQIDTATPTAAA